MHTQALASRNVTTLREPLTVTQLNMQVQDKLGRSFDSVWVSGEVSNCSTPRSGHCYFVLKDAAAQVSCVLFRGVSQQLDTRMQDGMHIVVRARVGLYVERGSYQLVVSHVEEMGDGALQRAFEALKLRLQTEGLFGAEHKKALPAFPRRIGVITSATGAAVKDILTVLQRRFACAEILIYPTQVQGGGAPAQLIKALTLADTQGHCDTLIIGRGGGALEDLWAFNDEALARAIHACTTPIISAVGHEVDFTITDFVADVRAPTPSAAAELAVPDGQALLKQLQQQRQQLLTTITQRLQHSRLRLQHALQRCRHPRERIQERAQRVDDLERRLRQGIHYFSQALVQRVSFSQQQLKTASPLHRVQRQQQYLTQLQQGLQQHITQTCQHKAQAFALTIHALEQLSPLRTLARGYAVATSMTSPQPLHNAAAVQQGEKIKLRLAKGALICRVEDHADL